MKTKEIDRIINKLQTEDKISFAGSDSYIELDCKVVEEIIQKLKHLRRLINVETSTQFTKNNA